MNRGFVEVINETEEKEMIYSELTNEILVALTKVLGTVAATNVTGGGFQVRIMLPACVGESGCD